MPRREHQRRLPGGVSRLPVRRGRAARLRGEQRLQSAAVSRSRGAVERGAELCVASLRVRGVGRGHERGHARGVAVRGSRVQRRAAARCGVGDEVCRRRVKKRVEAKEIPPVRSSVNLGRGLRERGGGRQAQQSSGRVASARELIGSTVGEEGSGCEF